ncbi:MAG: hypothetical protein LR015_02915 [Verrucomicrobia bacterium]|nr:hypothetical protein [Verrucomicrobiota bacterium]
MSSVLLFSIILAKGMVGSDVIEFNNGDLLHGSLVDEDDLYFYFESDNLGTLRIERAAVATLQLRLDPEGGEASIGLMIETPVVADEEIVEPTQEEPQDPVILDRVATPVVTLYRHTFDPLLNSFSFLIDWFNRYYP